MARNRSRKEASPQGPRGSNPRPSANANSGLALSSSEFSLRENIWFGEQTSVLQLTEFLGAREARQSLQVPVAELDVF